MSPPVHASCGVGFIGALTGLPSHEVVARGIEAVANLTHRGAVGADGKTGDGAGILFQIPRRFFGRLLREQAVTLSGLDALAVGVFFLPAVDHGLEAIEKIIERHGALPLLWRDVPVNNEALGRAALRAKPAIRHLVIDVGSLPPLTREVRLFLARREIEKTLGPAVTVPSLSSRTIAYKGMLVATHLSLFYPDLDDSDLTSAFCIFHQRFSTNTAPDWALAQPFRVLAHNGEINTGTPRPPSRLQGQGRPASTPAVRGRKRLRLARPHHRDPDPCRIFP